MKKISLVLIATSLLLFACDSNESEQLRFLPIDTKISKVSLHPDYQIPNELKDLEDDSEDIVKVKVTPNVIIGKEDKSAQSPYISTIREAQVIEVFKGTFKKDEIIKVSEPYFLNSNNEYQQLEGYTPMESEREYILFLRYGHEEDEVNGLVGIDYGKYSMDGKVQERLVSDLKNVGELKGMDFLSEDEHNVELYNTIKEDVLTKYMK